MCATAGCHDWERRGRRHRRTGAVRRALTRIGRIRARPSIAATATACTASRIMYCNTCHSWEVPGRLEQPGQVAQIRLPRFGKPVFERKDRHEEDDSGGLRRNGACAGAFGLRRIVRGFGVQRRRKRRAAGHARRRSMGCGGADRSRQEVRHAVARRRVHGHGQGDGRQRDHGHASGRRQPHHVPGNRPGWRNAKASAASRRCATAPSPR